MGNRKTDETLELLKVIDPHGDFDGLVEHTNEDFHGNIHSVREISTGKTYLSQGETYDEDGGAVVAIDREGIFEELDPREYDILEVLSWDENTDELSVVPYEQE